MTRVHTEKEYTSKESAFYGIVILNGTGTISSKDETYDFKPGDQFFIPNSTDTITIKPKEQIELIKCFGPKA